MDKDLIRIMIFAIGLLVILGMIAWSYLQHEKFRQNLDDYSHINEEDGLAEEDDEFGLNSLNDQEAENTYYNQKTDQVEQAEKSTEPVIEEKIPAQASVAPKKPAVVQFSIMAKTDQGFNGVDLFEALDDVGLEYGNLQIFERLDARRLVDFGVASVVKPGIFPSTNLAAFNCPGIVFFMQPGKVDNPAAVFNDFLRTFNFVALKLDGLMLNQERELLSEEDINQIRQSLETP